MRPHWLALPWAGLSAVVALVLFVLWRSRRGGHLDWVVWHPDLGLLRREQTKRAALDRAPELARQRPLYPYAGRPLKQSDRPQESLGPGPESAGRGWVRVLIPCRACPGHTDHRAALRERRQEEPG